MPNLSTISQEDLRKFPNQLKGKQIGDVITAKERNALSEKAEAKAGKAEPEKAEKTDEKKK